MRVSVAWLAVWLWAGTAAAEPVTFEVEVPYCTPVGSTVLLRSNRLDAGTYVHDALMRVGPTLWRGTFEVTTDRSLFRYKYAHAICEGEVCPGIEKGLEYTGTGADVPDRALAAGVTMARDLVYVWRSALVHLDATGRVTGPRTLPDEQVAFCAPYLSVLDDGVLAVGYDSYDAGEVVLEFGETEAYGTTIPRRGTHRNHFRLPALEPGREYHYRIVEDGVAGPDHVFRAPPGAGDAFRFAWIGDTQYYEEPQRQDHLRFTELLLAHDPDLVVAVGDLVASEPGPGGPGGWMYPETARWNVFFGVAAEMMARAPFMTAMGNHEEDVPYYWDVFAFPTPDAPALDHYDFRYGSVAFFVLYTGSTDGYNVDAILASTTPWLDRALAAADADPLVRWKVVLLHRGPLSQGANHPTDGRPFWENGSPSWRELYGRHGVDLVLAGHNHNFTYATADGIRYLTTCSGAPVHDLREPQEPTTVHAERACAVGLFTVSARTLAFEARRLDGSEIEEASFALCREATDCAELPSDCAGTAQWLCEDGACVEDQCLPGVDAGIDAGSDMDAGSDIDSGAGTDAGSEADAGDRPPSGSFCDCATASPAGSLPILLALLALLVRRRAVR